LGWAVLLLTQIADSWVYQLPLIILAGKVIPLLIFLPGMLKENLRSYIWLCFVQPDSVLAAVGMFGVVTMFIAAMMFVRWRARELKSAKAPLSNELGEK
jgi:uncharacterized membrane protein